MARISALVYGLYILLASAFVRNSQVYFVIYRNNYQLWYAKDMIK